MDRIRKEIMQTRHTLFLRYTNDSWKYFAYLYFSLFPEGFRAASLTIKVMPSLKSRVAYIANICEKKYQVLH